MGMAITRACEEIRGCHVGKADCSLHPQEEPGCNPSSLGTPDATAKRLEVTPKTRGETYIQPESFNILDPRRCEQHPSLRTVVAGNI